LIDDVLMIAVIGVVVLALAVDVGAAIDWVAR
jgi:hypothetical protein